MWSSPDGCAGCSHSLDTLFVKPVGSCANVIWSWQLVVLVTGLLRGSLLPTNARLTVPGAWHGCQGGASNRLAVGASGAQRLGLHRVSPFEGPCSEVLILPPWKCSHQGYRGSGKGDSNSIRGGACTLWGGCRHLFSSPWLRWAELPGELSLLPLNAAGRAAQMHRTLRQKPSWEPVTKTQYCMPLSQLHNA